MQLFEHIKKILAKEPSYILNGEVFRNRIIEAAFKNELNLLRLLVNDPKAKAFFFEVIDGILIFDKLKFQKFINNKNFLPDSFTAFKNSIGLANGEEYYDENKSVFINFPYKDCILEGGQVKEEEKRKEIFWNETLAFEEIDKLFEPKVLVNWKKIDGKNTSKPKDITAKDNLILRGNNLIALHSLKKVFAGKVKLIYIDPPYNTGSDSFQYNDSFNHATWLVFMKNRLQIAWELLSNEGAFFIQVDDSEFAYLKILCDEIFGRENHRETIILKSSTESGVNAINVKRGERLFKVKEYILFYSKSKMFRFQPFYTKTDFNLNYKFEVVKNNGKYTVTDLFKKIRDKYAAFEISKNEKEILARNEFVRYALNHSENIYSLEKNIKKAGGKFKKFAELNKPKGIVEEFLNSQNQTALIYEGGVLVPLKERIVEEEGKKYFGVLASDLWVDIGTTASAEGGIKFSNGKKPEKLLKRIIEMTTKKGDLVLDYHLGSGTTAAVAHKMQRQYIGLEQLDYGENDATERLKNVINGELSGISKSVNWNGGGSFVYAELAKNNLSLIEEIQKADRVEQLLKLYDKLKDSKFLNYKISKDQLINLKENFKKLDLATQQKALISFLDKNELYIAYSEMHDTDYLIDKDDKILTEQFYNL